MKYAFETPEAPLPSYPQFGKGCASGHPYVKFGKRGQWHSLINPGLTHSADSIKALPVGTTLTLTQE